MREDYNKWRDTAQKAMVKYQVGEMSFEQICGMHSNSIESKQTAQKISLLCGLLALL